MRPSIGGIRREKGKRTKNKKEKNKKPILDDFSHSFICDISSSGMFSSIILIKKHALVTACKCRTLKTKYTTEPNCQNNFFLLFFFQNHFGHFSFELLIIIIIIESTNEECNFHGLRDQFRFIFLIHSLSHFQFSRNN